jgi:hypothetical protein
MLDVNALRAEIARNGMTQGQVANSIGMTASTFSKKIKTGNFGLDEAQKLIDLLGMSDPGAVFFAKQ